MDKEKVKAMKRLIFLVRRKQSDGLSEVASELDKLGVPMWKQNNIAYLSSETNWYMNDIIKEVYYIKKPLDLQSTIKKWKQRGRN